MNQKYPECVDCGPVYLCRWHLNDEQLARDIEAARGVKPASIDATLGERGKRYGKFKNHAAITQSLKDVMRGCGKWPDLDYDQIEALEMIAHKIGRILNGDPNYADSWIDIAGYAKLVADRLEGIER